MGSASSKAARASAAAAKSGKKPSWSGARVPVYDPKTSPSLRARVPAYDPTTPPSPRARQPWASESKDEGKYYLLLGSNVFPCSNKSKKKNTPEIERDAKDPQLLANLNRLGPVKVHHHLLPAETVSPVLLLVQQSTSPMLILMASSVGVSAKEARSRRQRAFRIAQ
jgi:hypothetical protein